MTVYFNFPNNQNNQSNNNNSGNNTNTNTTLNLNIKTYEKIYNINTSGNIDNIDFRTDFYNDTGSDINSIKVLNSSVICMNDNNNSNQNTYIRIGIKRGNVYIVNERIENDIKIYNLGILIKEVNIEVEGSGELKIMIVYVE